MAEVRRRKPDEAGDEADNLSASATAAAGHSTIEKRNSSAAESSDHVSCFYLKLLRFRFVCFFHKTKENTIFAQLLLLNAIL